VPTHPVAFEPNTVFTLNSAFSTYWVDVPPSYDASHATPMTLFVWLHGCGGYGQYDISMVSPGSARDYISIAVGGRENQCWHVDDDAPTVLAAIADMKTHFNINPHRVVLGGYSSGGDLTYRTAFYNANMFAGVLVETRHRSGTPARHRPRRSRRRRGSSTSCTLRIWRTTPIRRRGARRDERAGGRGLPDQPRRARRPALG